MDINITRIKDGLTGYQLKVIAILFMLIDHINMYLGGFLGWPAWVGFLGRFVAPLFAFLLVEGYFHTHSKRKYLERLLLGALIVGIGNIVYNLLTHDYLNPVTHQPDYFLFLGPHNIFLTLAMELVLIWSLDNILKHHRIVSSIFTLIVSAGLMLFFEGGFYLLPLAIIFFLGQKYCQTNLMLTGIVLWCGFLFIRAWLSFNGGMTGEKSFYNYLTFNNEFMMVMVVPFIWLYNGQRGGNGSRAEKNFFYYFYPIHLWIIYLIKAFV